MTADKAQTKKTDTETSDHGKKSASGKFDDLKGLAAFIVGGLLLAISIFGVLGYDIRYPFYQPFHQFDIYSRSYHPFHEIEWNNRAVIDSITTHILEKDGLGSFINKKVAYDSGHSLISKDSVGSRREKLNKQYYKVLHDIRDSARTLNDSQFYACNAAVAMPVKDNLTGRINDSTNTLPVAVQFKTTRIPGFVYPDTLYIPVTLDVPADDFLVKYSSFGLWALLIILQLPMYFLLFIWLWWKLFEDHNNKFIMAIPDNGLYRAGKPIIYKHIVGCVIPCIALSIALLYSDRNDMVKPGYFMLNLKWVLGITNILGYLSAALCLAGMLLIYISIRRIKEVKLEEDRKWEAAAKTETATPGANPDPVKEEEDKKKKEEKEKQEKEKLRLQKEEKYNDLAGRFNLFFTILAIILTLATLSTSNLFAGLNSIPYIKALAVTHEGSLFPADYVYLYGLIHSAILLAVYSLVRSQLKELKKTLGIKAEDDINNPTFAKKIGDLITTTGPLLVPGLKAIFDLF